MSISTKQRSYVTYTVTTGGTVTIPNGILTSDPNVDTVRDYVIEGTSILIADLTYTMTTPVAGTDLTLYWKASVTPSGFAVTVLGQIIPSRLLTKTFILRSTYNGSSWDNVIIVDNTETANIDGTSLVDATVPDAKIIAVAASKLTGTVADSQIAAMNANKLTGSIDAARYANNTIPALAMANSSLTATQMADGAITIPKLASTGTLHVSTTGASTTAVTTEETLSSYSLAANIVPSTGKGIKVKGAFTFAANAHVKTVKLKINGQIIYNSATAVTTDVSPNDARLYFQFDLIRTGATTAKVMGFSLMSALITDTAPGVGTVTGLDFTAIQPILWTGQNGTASAGDITFELGSVELIL